MTSERESSVNDSVSGEVFTVLEFVDAAAIGALGLTGVGHVEVDLGVTAPDLHVGQQAWTKHATLVVQIFGEKFNRRVVVHADTLVNQ